MDRVTRAKIDSLLYELRARKEGGAKPTASSLAVRFHLDPMLVRRIAQSEGIELDEEEDDAEVDPNQTTAVMSQDEIDLR